VVVTGRAGSLRVPRPPGLDHEPRRQTITTAIFARTDVLGFERMEYELTSDAIALGLDAALPAVFELRDQIREFGRGERDSPSLTQRSLSFLLVNATPREPPTPYELVRSA
jgi:hypothetical protein